MKKIDPLTRCIAIAGSQRELVRQLRAKGYVIDPSTVTYWIHEGVPSKWWSVLDAAFGVPSLEFFQEHERRAKREAR